ncbi:MAG: glycosyltransferase family 4 protein [Anaerococcus prevotii]|uniref:glycosyltransferase family 4 protein n=1 Tax=Anaerococcus prevotii TaxID=33034 RepID=UPI0029045043|nr:glycosyltransferase family 4 protein [Anaerococcus prevotii]MDU2557886.1 glycosyltransferase family 4 protein [Anaerococcus prevotii]MDU2583937.1 glycosyltransferase family 4 protein [Anaerococcus prevotii]
MRVLIYSKDYDKVKESGVGKAIDHQKKALRKVGFDFTTDEKEDYELVHINTVLPGAVAFAKKARKKGKKVIYHGHSTMEDFRNSFVFSNQVAPLFKKWLVHTYKLGDIVLTPSEYSKKILETYGIDREICVISNGIDLDFWKEKDGDRDKFYETYGLDKNKKSIISVGLPIKRKGIDDFIRLGQSLPQYEFVWFGKLDRALMSPNIKKLIDLAPSNVSFPGYVSSEDLRLAYSGSDLYLFLTHEETEGIVLLEALATRADILIRDIEIFETDYEDGVNIYKGSSLEDFREKIVGICEGRLKSLKDLAYRKAQDKSIEKTGRKLVEIYERVMNNEIGC